MGKAEVAIFSFCCTYIFLYADVPVVLVAVEEWRVSGSWASVPPSPPYVALILYCTVLVELERQREACGTALSAVHVSYSEYVLYVR